MELNNRTLEFMAKLGTAMESMDVTWPDDVNAQIAIEWHGEQIATWGFVAGATVWRFAGND